MRNTPMFRSIQALSATQAYVLGLNGNLWLEPRPPQTQVRTRRGSDGSSPTPLGRATTTPTRDGQREREASNGTAQRRLRG
jgi:hypothetical protein